MSKPKPVLIILIIILTLLFLPVSACAQPQAAEEAAPASAFNGLPYLPDIVAEVMPSVVYIFVEQETADPARFSSSSGSGVILRSDGYILTNRHVVENAVRAEVTLQDRSVYEATDIWQDDLLDLAVVKIDARGLPAATFAEPSDIRVGEWVIALGHPLGLSPKEGGATVTVGIVSNLGRSFTMGGIPYYDIIQTDAAINPGNSGGPLVNLDGELIGINSAGIGEAQNINFAINVGTARRVYEDVLQYGRVLRPYLGAVLDDITPATACRYCLSKRVGALVIATEPDGPADAAGLAGNDVIVEFGGAEIISATQLLKELWRHEAGDKVTVVYWRGDTQLETEVLLSVQLRQFGF